MCMCADIFTYMHLYIYIYTCKHDYVRCMCVCIFIYKEIYVNTSYIYISKVTLHIDNMMIEIQYVCDYVRTLTE